MSSNVKALQQSQVEQNLQASGIIVPEVSAPAAAYVPYKIIGNQVVISGQLPFKDGALAQTGHVGKDVSVAQGQETAKICALNVLAHLKNACGGNLDRVKQAVKLEILVSCPPDFTEPHVIANGASELIIAAFGEEKGKHSRVAYGVSSLPMGVSVEVAATFEIQ